MTKTELTIIKREATEAEATEAALTAYSVTFNYYDSGVWCSNIALAACEADVMAEYSRHTSVTVRPAEGWELDEARRKGKPIITCQPAAQEAETETETEAAAEQEARRAELADIPEWVHDPDQWDGRYDYREAVTACAMSAIIDDGYITKEGRVVDDLTREELEERLSNELWTSDSVTGNGSGSFFFSSWRAETALRGNWGLLAEALRGFGQDGVDVLEEGAEAMDVTLRCYLLSECITAALDRLEAEDLITYGD